MVTHTTVLASWLAAPPFQSTGFLPSLNPDIKNIKIDFSYGSKGVYMSGFDRYDQRQIMLLGISKELLLKVFGEPVAAFQYRGRELLHYGRPGLSYVEVEHGLVKKCETLLERRAAFRVQPALPTNVHIINRFGELSGVIIDISTSGMAVRMKQPCLCKALDKVFLRFYLPLNDKRCFFTIPAFFYRSAEVNGSNKMIFILALTEKTELYNRLDQYVMERQLEMLIEYKENCKKRCGLRG